jgi:hypothetical protein
MDDGENSEEKLLNSARSYKPSYQASEFSEILPGRIRARWQWQ